jgi:CHASE2 domain-containing sensor protein
MSELADLLAAISGWPVWVQKLWVFFWGSVAGYSLGWRHATRRAVRRRWWRC